MRAGHESSDDTETVYVRLRRPDADSLAELVVRSALPQRGAAVARSAADSDARADLTAQRLGALSVVLGGGALLAVALNVLSGLWLELESERVMTERALCHGAVLALSVVVFALTRSRRLRPQMLRIGLTYEVLGAWGVALPSVFDHGLVHDFPGRMTWVCLWITFFPLLIPASARRQLPATVLAASAVPVLLLATWCLGAARPSVEAALEVALPPLICAVLASLSARFVRGLELRAARAEATVEQLGSYHLVELLGQGGMGEVWRARHSLLARSAAIKIIGTDALRRDPAALADALARFRREAEVLAALTDPHTVSIYDYGSTREGKPYIAMELLDGVDLEQLVERFGPVPQRRAVHILLQACSSLAEAHAAGLVHRDVKPANICVCRVGLRFDFVKLLDFGLVGRFSTDVRGERLEAEFVVGTPAFMAPEAIRGQDPDPRSDVYSLGCVAHWLLTGDYVFPGEVAGEVMLGHLHDPPPDLPTGTLPRLAGLVRRSLAKRPRERWPTIDAVAAELRRCEREFGQAWSQQEAGRWWGEHPHEPGASTGRDAARCPTVPS